MEKRIALPAHLEDTEHETDDDETGEVLGRSGCSRDDTPASHADVEVDSRLADASSNHVRRDLEEDVRGEQDTDDGLVFRADQASVLHDAVQACRSDVVSVEVVEDVCDA